MATAMESWFVINTKPKKEFQVKKMFEEAGFNYYNPVYKAEGRIRPFFPGYGFLFFRFPDHYQLVRFTRGVKRVVGNRDGPIPIPEGVIQEIKRREVNGLVELAKYGEEPEVGDEVEIAEGPWKGLRGIFKKELSDKDRVMILLSYVSYQGQLLIEKKKLKKVIK
jgi:transcription antitermination factor NusG